MQLPKPQMQFNLFIFFLWGGEGGFVTQHGVNLGLTLVMRIFY